jgi:hypothetical protein
MGQVLSEAKNEPTHELARLDVLDLAPDLLDDAGVFVAHRGRPVDRVDPAIGPQVRAADAGRGQADDRVAWFDDLGVVAFFNPDVAGGIQDSTTHGWVPFSGG